MPYADDRAKKAAFVGLAREKHDGRVVGNGIRKRRGHARVGFRARCAHGLSQLCNVELERDEEDGPKPQRYP